MLLLQLLLYLAMLYNIVLAVIILWRTQTHSAGGSFAWYILSSAAWTGCVATAQFTGNKHLSLLLIRATFFCATFITISWLWFCAEFPVVSTRFRRAAFILIVLTLPWLYLAWTRYMIPPNDLTFQYWGVDVKVGPLVLCFGIWSELFMAIGAMHLLYKRKQIGGFERLQIRYILLGYMGLVIVGGITNMFLPAITSSSRFGPFGPLASLFVTTTTTYAIVRYRLMDIKIILRAGLIYSITIGMLALIFALLVPLIDHLLATHFSMFPRAGSFSMAFLMALSFQPLRRYIQKVVDHRFFKSVYDYRLTLREAGSALASAHDREILMTTLVNAIARTLRPHNLAVYLPERQEQLTLATTMLGTWVELPEQLPPEELLLVYSLAMDDILLTDELIRQHGMMQVIGASLQGWGVYVAMPLIAGGRLSGMVLLGEKLSGDVYTTDDVGLLRILGKQAAIALDNARHFDEMVILNEYHERLLHSMQDGVIALAPDELLITFNPSAERITGLQAGAVMGQRLSDIGMTHLPVIDTGDHPLEITLTTPNGIEIPLLISVTPFRRRWDSADSHLIVFRDLSALRALEQEKMQVERFSSMGAMAASLAHEIKNPLVPIQMFAHLLPTKYDDEEFRKDFSVTVVNEVERISRLVGQMLDLVRKPSYDRGLVDVRDVTERLLTVTRADYQRHAIQVHTHFSEDLLGVFGVASEVYQALLNVMVNSIQAMPDGGELFIDVQAVGNEVVCRIADTGPGVSPEDLPRLFEPLFTTKVGGHGLGLALTYQFVRANGGEIHAECPPGQGLMVMMSFPASRAAETELLCT